MKQEHFCVNHSLERLSIENVKMQKVYCDGRFSGRVS